jgi:hypothetical protein
MDNNKIMTILLAEYVMLAEEASELQEAFGSADPATERAVAKKITILNLINRINEETN